MNRLLTRDVGDFLFYVSLAIFTVLTYTANITVLTGVLVPLAYVALAFLFLAFLFRLKRYRAEELLILVLLLAVSFYQMLATGNFSFIKLVLLLAAVKGLPLDECIRFDLTVRVVCGLGLVVLCTMGAAEDVVMIDAARGVRHSYGFPNPNQLGMAVLIASLEAIYLQRDRLRAIPTLLIIIAVAWSSSVTGSRSTVLIVALALFLSLLRTIWPRAVFWNGAFRIVAENAALALFLLTWIAYFLFIGGNSVAIAFDELSTGRLSRIALFAAQFDPSLLGEDLSVANASLDTAYAYMVYGYGVFMTVVFLLAYRLLLGTLCKNGNHSLAIVLFCLAIYGFTERLWLCVEYDGLMLAFAMVLYQQWDRFLGNGFKKRALRHGAANCGGIDSI